LEGKTAELELSVKDLTTLKEAATVSATKATMDCSKLTVQVRQLTKDLNTANKELNAAKSSQEIVYEWFKYQPTSKSSTESLIAEAKQRFLDAKNANVKYERSLRDTRSEMESEQRLRETVEFQLATTQTEFVALQKEVEMLRKLVGNNKSSSMMTATSPSSSITNGMEEEEEEEEEEEGEETHGDGDMAIASANVVDLTVDTDSSEDE
jgi:hypothetical protein